MKRENNLLRDAFPIFMEIPISYASLINNFNEDSEIYKKIKKNFEELASYLERYRNGKDVSINIMQTMAVWSDQNLNKVISTHKGVIYNTLAVNLNIINEWNDIIREDNLSERNNSDKIKLFNKGINNFKNVKNVDELKEKFPFFYNKTYLPQFSSTNDVLQQLGGLTIDNYKKMNRKIRRKKFEKYDKVLKLNIKYLENFNSFINDYANFFENILKNINEINNFIIKNYIDINNLNENEYKKIDLLIAVSLIQTCKNNDLYKYDDKVLLYLKNFIQRNKDNFDLNIKVKTINNEITVNKKGKVVDFQNSILKEDYNLIEINFDDVVKMYNELIKGKEYINEIDTSYDYSKMTRNEILNIVNQLLQRSQNDFKNMSKEELKEKIIKLNKSYDPNDINARNKIKSLNNKIEFLIENEPITFIKGINKFKDYTGFVYKNGYVVLDTISESIDKSYGHAIYILKLEDLNRYSDLSLTELKENHRDKVIRIRHSKDWKSKVEKIITTFQDAKDILIPDEIKEINKATSLEQLIQIKNDLPMITDEVETKIEKKKKRIKQIKAIDEEIKQNETADELYKSEEESLLEDEDRLLSNGGESMDFISLHELSKNIRKTIKRNPDVSLRTKLRTKDKNGFIHCDFCGCDSIYGSNKSTRMFETHHIIPISEGGIDNLYNTACLCPGCHRRIHNFLRLRKILDTNPNIELPEGVLGEIISFSEWGNFLQNVRSRIENDTPEYLPYFDDLFMSGRKDISESDTQQLSEENYKFLTEWNTFKSDNKKAL